MSETLINDDDSPSFMPPHRQDLLDALADITNTYSSTIFSAADKAIDLLVQYEEGGLKLVTQLGVCRQEEAEAAQEMLRATKAALVKKLKPIEKTLREEGEKVRVVGADIEGMKVELAGRKKEWTAGLKGLEGLC